MKKKKGFTLIELLIVVAIIAILALIAVPNFLEAQVRSKVSRVKSELRTLATGIEAYAADHNAVPKELNNTFYGDTYNGVAVWGLLSPVITTPVAYITKFDFVDPFQAKDVGNPLDEQLYSYHDIKKRIDYYTGTTQEFWLGAREFYGNWRLVSVGPDKVYGHGFTRSAQLVYDPSNGTISLGNIIRGQKISDSIQPPAGTGPRDLIYPH